MLQNAAPTPLGWHTEPTRSFVSPRMHEARRLSFCNALDKLLRPECIWLATFGWQHLGASTALELGRKGLHSRWLGGTLPGFFLAVPPPPGLFGRSSNLPQRFGAFTWCLHLVPSPERCRRSDHPPENLVLSRRRDFPESSA